MREAPPGMITVSEAIKVVGVGRTQVINLLNSGHLIGTAAEGTGTPRFVDRSSAESYSVARRRRAPRGTGDPRALDTLVRRLEDLTSDVERASDALGVRLDRHGDKPTLDGKTAARALAQLQATVARRDAQIAKLMDVAREEKLWREAVEVLLKKGERIRELYRDALRE